jgi:diguanylate cyclase (GGDEF)-like protein
MEWIFSMLSMLFYRFFHVFFCLFCVAKNKIQNFCFLLALSLFIPNTAFADPFNFEKIQAERLELENLSEISRNISTLEIDRRITEAKDDRARLASLYLFKAHVLKHNGLEHIKENLSKAMPLIDAEKQPELYLYSMVVKSYALYMYEGKAELAVDILEKVLKHPAFKNDLFLQVNALSNLLESYYQLKRFDEVSRPLFTIFKTLSPLKIEKRYQSVFHQIETELAYHSAQIGDVEQAKKLYTRAILHARENGKLENVAISYCNMANIYFISLQEKIEYAKASLAAHRDTPCFDLMEKIVILDEILRGDLANVSRLSVFDSSQKMPTLNERSAYFAGLAYLHINDLSSAQQMIDRITDLNNWERYDLLLQLYKKKGNYAKAFEASKKYNELRAQKDADARSLMLRSYQTRLDLANEDTRLAENAKKAEQLAAAEQKAQSRLHLAITVICAAVLITIVMVLYLFRSKQIQQKLQHLSDTDPLTGLLNRRAFLRQTQQLKLLSKRHQFPFAITVIDLDFFKKINDQHGHQAGDTVLRLFAKAAQSTLRQTDLIGRFGGEEFILASTQQDSHAVTSLLQRLQQTFSKLCLSDAEISFNVSFSAGIAYIGENDLTDSTEIESAIIQADEQLYLAKANGRKQVCIQGACFPLEL